MDRMGQISEGAKQSTGHYPVKRFMDWAKGLMPKGGEGVSSNEGVEPNPNDLGQQIAGVSRMVQNPESTSTDWSGMQNDFMETGNLEDISDEDLALLFGELTGNEPSERYQMIEDLTRIRDRQYSR